ncbi:1,4-alpha-glucan branching enzyme (plasmid) [Burkholderia sp. JP2-270]|uniref:1,4-alpha-glucan branching protein GlgB n=1 Tax=Burkholderia sp. JP2-270 TaxID=2217913 RepID=UPI000DA2D738|nr:1,4-alpha-glucan branching protein GlgB [Burkholderia sp. JP2-270]AWV05529.1 1,4-alpha-glucan branching enzyme [Burkholderia sp. JP2-270]
MKRDAAMHIDDRHNRPSASRRTLITPGDASLLLAGEHADPFAILGMHPDAVGDTVTVRCFLPRARRVDLVDRDTGNVLGALDRIDDGGLYAGKFAAPGGPFRYRFRVHEEGGQYELDDPYAAPRVLGDLDCHLLAQGRHWNAYRHLGAHACRHGGLDGTTFAVWAPNAQRVSVVGPFNDWDGRVNVMRRRAECGVWECFMPGVGPGTLYKYEVRTRDGIVMLKADPFAQFAEVPPETASCVCEPSAFCWTDAVWMESRHMRQRPDAPISVYEVHTGSWRRHPDGRAYSYDDLADALIPYVLDLGFTHIELMPLGEHPFAGSWGYQIVSPFAPSRRWGTADALRGFIDRCHRAGIGVLLDWVPGHFPRDAHGLARFDGTCLYEHEDPRMGVHHRWGTLVFNVGRAEVANYLIANALYWLREFHIDGLRVDAVASMLYLDYDRAAHEWIPNSSGGRENLDAVAFLRCFNDTVRLEAPHGAITIAEDSTAWPMVSRPVDSGGIGFDYKWNMGWMNDTLAYMRRDPVHRRFHHDQLTFGILYAWTENFVLALSHDEVVHGKGSLLSKMPGDRWQRFANLRLYLSFQFLHPGKKLLFMGSEFGQPREWDHDSELDWACVDDPGHAGVLRLVRDLGHLYRTVPCLHRRDCSSDGFRWIDCADRLQGVLAWRRIGDTPHNFVVAVCNLTPVCRTHYRVGIPYAGTYREILNSDAAEYGGSGAGNLGQSASKPEPWHGEQQCLELTLPPLGMLVFAAPSR